MDANEHRMNAGVQRLAMMAVCRDSFMIAIVTPTTAMLHATPLQTQNSSRICCARSKTPIKPDQCCTYAGAKSRTNAIAIKAMLMTAVDIWIRVMTRSLILEKSTDSETDTMVEPRIVDTRAVVVQYLRYRDRNDKEARHAQGDRVGGRAELAEHGEEDYRSENLERGKEHNDHKERFHSLVDCE
ncbi:hypothetical protein BC831DRAFT_484711 [Entophlyctis helioformis]|nr:hypothetical protein BC831DRAFT_484711 [Entophlyctis helioformis]